MENKVIKNICKIVATAMALCFAAFPMHASAAEGEQAIESVGVAAIFEMDYSAEE